MYFMPYKWLFLVFAFYERWNDESNGANSGWSFLGLFNGFCLNCSRRRNYCKLNGKAGISFTCWHVVIFVLTIRLPGVMNPDTMMMSMPHLLKDVALNGGALLLAGIFSKEG